MSNLLKKEKGFTLIEIVLVLAIAGLLLVIVFLAVSGAQKSRRDTQRKTDLSRIASQIESYASNTNGLYPGMTGASTFAAFSTSNYITGSNLEDPNSGAAYTYATGATPGTTPGSVAYQIPAAATCDGAANTNGRTYVIRMTLEQGTACRDNK